MLTMHNEMTKARPDAGPVITIVAPALDEAVNLPVFAERIRRALQSMDMDWELIIVDDGSSDDSQRVLNDLHETDPRIGFVSLSRSFGQQMAILAGLDVARGGAAIVMDADLQQPPELIPELIRHWQQGARIVHMVRKTRGGRWSLKSIASRAFYAAIRHLTSVPIAAGAAEFFLVDRQVLDYLLRCRERSRFNRGLLAWVGFRRDMVEYEVAPRHSGSSKFPLWKAAQLGLDAIFGFSVVPLRILGALGLMSVFATFVYAVYVIAAVIFGGAVVQGWPSIVVLIGWFGSVQMLSLWALGEYVARAYLDVIGRPEYVVAEAALPGRPANPDRHIGRR